MKDLLFIGFIILLNIPFGYWRYGVKKFSFPWVLAIHIPVLIIIASRYFFDIPYHLLILPLNVGAFFLGQFLGGKLFFEKKPTK